VPWTAVWKEERSTRKKGRKISKQGRKISTTKLTNHTKTTNKNTTGGQRLWTWHCLIIALTWSPSPMGSIKFLFDWKYYFLRDLISSYVIHSSNMI